MERELSIVAVASRTKVNRTMASAIANGAMYGGAGMGSRKAPTGHAIGLESRKTAAPHAIGLGNGELV